MFDFLDSLGERHPTKANGHELHLALANALDPDGPLSDYYRHHPDRDERDAELYRWAHTELPADESLEWFELTAAASASVVILSLLALAGKADLTDSEVQATHAAYWPSVSLATTMLDNYANQAEDIASGNHNYFTHYPNEAVGVRRLAGHIAEAMTGVRALAHGERHAVAVGAMVAMYISKETDHRPATRRARRDLDAAGALSGATTPNARPDGRPPMTLSNRSCT